MNKPYDPLGKIKEKLVFITDEDFVNADIYSEQLDFVFSVSAIKFSNLIKMLKNDKHLYLECLEYIND